MKQRSKRLCALGIAALAAGTLASAAARPAPHAAARTRVVALPGGSAGIGFDDLQYSARLDRVLIPAGRTGDLDLLDPATDAVTTIRGFSATRRFAGGHGEGITSVTEDGRWLFVTDRTTDRLDVIDSEARRTVASTRLASGPDYVRFVASRRELWVTEPGRDRIEVFRLTGDAPPTPVHDSFIAVKGGPESLVVDGRHGRAYTHLWAGRSVAIDLTSRRIVATWPNGCNGSRGIALDPAHGWLFAGCAEGKAVVMDLNRHGAVISSLRTGAGVDIIDFSASLGHLYVPGATSATLSILAVSPEGQLSLAATVPAAPESHCVVADTHGNAYVCDPRQGALIVVHDPPGSGR